MSLQIRRIEVSPARPAFGKSLEEEPLELQDRVPSHGVSASACTFASDSTDMSRIQDTDGGVPPARDDLREIARGSPDRHDVEESFAESADDLEHDYRRRVERIRMCWEHALEHTLDFCSDLFGAARFELTHPGSLAPGGACIPQRGSLKRTAAFKVKSKKMTRLSSAPALGGEHHLDDNMEEYLELVTQHKPIFVASQCLLCTSFWLFFRALRSSPMAGLDSIWPGQTDLTIQWDCEDKRHEVWRWFTYQFTHVDAMHIVMNLVMLILMGIPLEGFHGTLKVAFMFNVGVVGGACCSFVSAVHSRVVGMSGGCYALVGMHVADLVVNWSDKPYTCQKLILLVILAEIDIVAAFLSSGSRTSHSVHMGGWFSGLIIGILVGRNLVVQKFERPLRIFALCLGLGMLITCVSWAMTFPPQDIWEQVRWCWARQVSNATIFGDTNWHCVRCQDADCIAKWSKQEFVAEVSASVCTSELNGWAFTER